MIIFDSLNIVPSGCNIIEASAGTGKTYAITSLYLRLIVENELYKPENILVVTFTEAATKELRDRIRKRLRDARDVLSDPDSDCSDPFLNELMSEKHSAWSGTKTALLRLEQALQSFDCASIFTIHGFCSRVLQENAFECGSLFDTELITNQKPIISQIVDDFWRIKFFAKEVPLLPLIELKKWSPKTFASFLKGKLTNPSVRIVPDFTSDEADNIKNYCNQIYANICNIWLNKRDEIEKILFEHPGLSRNQKYYNHDRLPELSKGMDAFLSGASPYNLFDGHKKLTSKFMNQEDVRLKKNNPPEHQFFTLWDEMVNAVDKVALTVYSELIIFAKERFYERKDILNFRFFDDLLIDLYQALIGSAGVSLVERIRKKYRAGLIDEFQDTDQIQYKIFKQIFKEGSTPLFLIGDPKQAIYSFRGADIYAYLEAKKEVAEEHCHTMEINWRSSENMVQAVNTMFSINKDYPLVIDGLSYPEVKAAEIAADEKKELIAEKFDKAPMQIWFFSRTEKEKKNIPLNRAYPSIVKAVVDEIASLLKDAADDNVVIGTTSEHIRVAPADIAVIVRDHKQANMIYDSLQLRGIPAVVRSNQSIFQTPEAIELSTIINAVANFSQESKIRAALATSILGASASYIARTFEPNGEAEWEKRLNSFREYHKIWQNYGFISMFRALLDAEGVRGRLLSFKGGERSVTNLLHCGELLHDTATSSYLGIDALSSWFCEQITTPPEGEEHQIRLESDEKAVKILTIHVSKGLEFPIVFCPFLWGGVIDGGETVVAHEGYELVADFGSDKFDEHHAAAVEEGLAENVRLLYVALTRAKYRCYVAWGRFHYSESSALAYLFHSTPKIKGSSFYQELINFMEDITDDKMIQKIRSVVSEGVINLVIDPEHDSAPEFIDRTDTLKQLSCRVMNKQIEADWRVTSFSSLIDGHRSAPEYPDYDSFDEPTLSKADDLIGENVSFAFPRGADPGTFLHSIFERVDFASKNENQRNDMISHLLDRSVYGVKYTDVVAGMVSAVVDIELSEGLKLSGLQPGNWVQEMEFYFPLKSIKPHILATVFENNQKSQTSQPVDYATVLRRLDFKAVKGMLLGFIDLVFCHADKYYIVDWKSNYLGNKLEDYAPDNLAHEMERKLYPLQYLIYTVALNLHLKRKIPTYCYDKHFGGVYYVFLRGIDKTRKNNGIYFDKPEASIVTELTKYLVDFEEA